MKYYIVRPQIPTITPSWIDVNRCNHKIAINHPELHYRLIATHYRRSQMFFLINVNLYSLSYSKNDTKADKFETVFCYKLYALIIYK